MFSFMHNSWLIPQVLGPIKAPSQARRWTIKNWCKGLDEEASGRDSLCFCNFNSLAENFCLVPEQAFNKLRFQIIAAYFPCLAATTVTGVDYFFSSSPLAPFSSCQKNDDKSRRSRAFFSLLQRENFPNLWGGKFSSLCTLRFFLPSCMWHKKKFTSQLSFIIHEHTFAKLNI